MLKERLSFSYLPLFISWGIASIAQQSAYLPAQFRTLMWCFYPIGLRQRALPPHNSSQMSPAPRLLRNVMLSALACTVFWKAALANEQAYLGIWMAEGMSDVEHSQQIFILTVDQGSPAETAGLVSQDVILEIDGQRIHNRRAVFCIIKAARPGQTLRLAIRRQLQARTVLATLSEWPEDGISPSNPDCPPLETSFKDVSGRAKTAHPSNRHSYL